MRLGGSVDWWRRHFLPLEGATAVMATVALGVGLRWADLGKDIDAMLHGNRATAYGAVASVFGALLGFAITTFAIVLGYSQNERLQRVRDSAHYKTLWKVFSASVRALTAATLAPLIAILFDRDGRPLHWVGLVVVGAALLGLLRLVRCVWVLEHIVEIVTAPLPKSSTKVDPDSVA